MSTPFNQLLQLLETQKHPPVESWNPTSVGDIDIRIRDDGVWFHEGREIKRVGLARIFSSILRKEGSEFFLVTPAEKLRIRVDDAPFLAVDFEVEGEGNGQKILFRTNVDDVVLLGTDHPLKVHLANGEQRPYIEVRNGLQALISRSAFYRLVDYARKDGDEALLTSDGTTFRLN